MRAAPNGVASRPLADSFLHSQASSGSPDGVGLSARARALLERCRALTVNNLPAGLTQGFRLLSKSALDEYERCDDPAERVRIGEAADLAADWQQQICVQFERSLVTLYDEKVDRLARAGGSLDRSLEARIEEWRLVDDDVLEEEVAASRLAQRTLDDIDDEARFAVESRLGSLVDRPHLKGEANPLGLQTVFAALHRACKVTGASAALQMTLCGLLRGELVTRIAALYTQVNELLMDAGILPDLHYTVEQARDWHGEGKPAADPFDIEEFRRLTGGIGGLHGAPGAGAGPVDLRGVLSSVLSGPPAVLRYGARILVNPQSRYYQEAVATPVAPAVVDSLTQLQGSVRQVDPGTITALSGAELWAPFEALPESARHPLDRLTGELVSMVFDHIFDDPTLPAHVKIELARLQIVAFKACLLDRSFFARPEHPMRRMLAGIGDLAADPDVDASPGGVFASALTETVGYLVSHFERNLLIFDTALERLQQMVHRAGRLARAAVADLTQSLVAQERVQLAREHAVADMELRVTEGTPEFVARFLRSVWLEVIVDADLRQAKGEGSRARRIETAEQLLWSVAPKQPTDVQRLVDMLPGLVATLREGARTGGMTFTGEQTFLESLMQLHTELMAAAKAGAAVPRAPAAHAPTRAISFAARKALRAAAAVMRMSSIPRGAIVQFTQGDRTVRRKLVWVSPKRSRYIFCSTGAGPQCLTAKEFAEGLRTGQMVVLPDQGTIVDRAVAATTGEQAAA